MRKTIFSLLVLLLAVQHLGATTLYQQLCAFNPNWQKYAHRATLAPGRAFASDAEYIQAHLGHVLSILRHNPTAHLDDAQRSSRARNIQLLERYREGGLFPLNYHRRDRTPVFIDEHNTYCAVGFLMQQSGHADLARRIAARDNFAWVKDIRVPGLLEWQQASGLSVEELKLIQGAYDFYMPDAHLVSNRLEIPQKPTVVVRYFDDPATKKPLPQTPENIWCKGEGKNGVLHGRWTQNYAIGLPWIIGYFENGLRSGQWMEYYQGTKQLCRTEVWRNDKLNGKRIRYDRQGKVIEEILFRDGVAITKTNITHTDSLIHIRKRIDSAMVWTEIYHMDGSLLATGQERIHNPGNLQWFQNIELTALNVMAIQAQPQAQPALSLGRSRGGHPGNIVQASGVSLYNVPQLVNYRKEGTWTYYKEYNATATPVKFHESIRQGYRRLQHQIAPSIVFFDDFYVRSSFDSLRVTYTDDQMDDLHALGPKEKVHLQICYHDAPELNLNFAFFYPGESPARMVKECRRFDASGNRIGIWKHYDQSQRLYKVEDYVVAWRHE